jgi:hypothetical protein
MPNTGSSGWLVGFIPAPWDLACGGFLRQVPALLAVTSVVIGITLIIKKRRRLY